MLIPNEITNFINNCENCYISWVEKSGEIEVIPIISRKLSENHLILLVNKACSEQEGLIRADKAAITIWETIKGYQLKIKRVYEKKKVPDVESLDLIKQEFIQERKNIGENYLLIYKIDSIYHVTPGKNAGQRIT